MSRDDQFDRDAAERILRRAVELDESGPSLEGISERALVEAAEELGVDSSAVVRAASEERLGLLRDGSGLVERIAGPAVVTVTRTVDGAPAEVLDRIDGWLRRAGTLRRRRLGDDFALYARRDDPLAGVQRALRAVSGEENLSRVGRLRVSVRAVDERRSLVALGADLRVERTLVLVGASGVVGIGSAASAFAGMQVGWPWLGVPVSCAAGAAILVGRVGSLDDVETVLAGMLDRVVAGEKPSGVLGPLSRRLLGR